MKRDSLQRWTFAVPTALGMTQSWVELTDDGLHYTSNDPMGPSTTLPCLSIAKGCTAAAALGGRGAPDLPNGMPLEFEWLLLAPHRRTRPAFHARVAIRP